jgi:hypothetical protein
VTCFDCPYTDRFERDGYPERTPAICRRCSKIVYARTPLFRMDHVFHCTQCNGLLGLPALINPQKFIEKRHGRPGPARSNIPCPVCKISELRFEAVGTAIPKPPPTDSHLVPGMEVHFRRFPDGKIIVPNIESWTLIQMEGLPANPADINLGEANVLSIKRTLDSAASAILVKLKFLRALAPEEVAPARVPERERAK